MCIEEARNGLLGGCRIKINDYTQEKVNRQTEMRYKIICLK